MNRRTGTALDGSIKHWLENVEAKCPSQIKTGSAYCDLCHLFWSEGCRGCPVMTRTGVTKCYNSPFDAADEALEAWLACKAATPEWHAARDVWREKAQAQLNFLISLRPAKAAVPTKTAGAA